MELPLKKKPRKLKTMINNNLQSRDINIIIIVLPSLILIIIITFLLQGSKGVVVPSQDSAIQLYIYINQLEYCVVPENMEEDF